jgi:DNA-binding winged helix-turn-helix (wHTH) protein/dipeptidyl aminopeptidase/acylaminoacyl peptidase
VTPPDNEQRLVAFGEFRFDPVDRLLRRNGDEVPLPPRSLALLEALLAAGGRPVERGELLEQVWHDACVEDDALSQAISVLRQALDDDPRAPRYIRTLHGRGYRFVCPLREVTAQPERAPGEAHETTPAPLGRELPVTLPATAGSDALRGLAAHVVRAPRAAIAVAAAAGMIAGALLATAWLHRAPAGVRLSEVPTPGDATLSEMSPRSVAVSPDGRYVAMVAYRAEDSRIYLATHDRFGFAPVEGTEGAHGLFFAPGSDRLAYVDYRQRQIEVVDLSGGAPRPVCSPCDAVGGTWGNDGYLYYVGRSAGLFRVAAAGGSPESVRPLRPQEGEQALSPPRRTARGDGLLFALLHAGMTSWSEAEIVRFDPISGAETVLEPRGMEPRLLADGRLLFARNGTVLLAEPPGTGVEAPPRVVLEGIVTAGLTGAAQYDVAADGTLVYLPGDERTVTTRVLLVDGDGSRHRLELPDSLYIGARAARDGRRLALWVAGTSGHVWSFDRSRGVSTRQTFAGNNMAPVWAPDGRRFAYTASGGRGFDLLIKEADAAAAPQTVLQSSLRLVAGSFSPDGRYLAYTRWQPDGTTDIEWLDTVDGSSTPLEAGPFTERDAMLSADGAWLAFTSDETGAGEVYLRALAPGGPRVRVSRNGGSTPAFAPDGGAIFYLDAASHLVRVPLQLAAEPVLGEPRVVAEGDFLPSLDATAEGVLVVEEQEPAAPARAVRQVVGWLDDLGNLSH